MTQTMTMAEFLSKAGSGRIFAVSFVKRTTKEERRMLCRTRVTKGTKGGSIGYDPASKGLLSVYDVAAGGFRMVNLDELLSVKMAGKRFIWDRRVGQFVEVPK